METWKEFLMDSDPNDINSFLSIGGITMQGSQISWESSASRVYDVQAAADLSGPWEALENGGDLSGTGGVMTFNNSSMTNSALFYRVLVKEAQ